MNKRRSLWLLPLLALLGLSACAGPVQRQAESAMVHNTEVVQKTKAPAATPTISISPDKWLLGRPVRVETPKPRWVYQFVTLNSTRAMTMQQIAARLETMTGVNLQIDPSSNKVLQQKSSEQNQGQDGEKRIVVSYSGDLNGLLNQIAASFGLYWRLSDGSVVFFAQETRTFHLPALPISVTNTGTITTTTGSTASSSSASGGSPTTTGSGTIMQSDSLNVNTWATIQQTAQAVAGAGAQVVTDPSNAMLVVSGAPTQIQRVANWVDSLSSSMRKLIAIDVQVYDVSTNKENQFGFNPSVLFKNLGQRYGFTLSGIAAPQPTTGTSPMSIGATILAPLTGGGGTGTLPSFGPVGTDSSGKPVYLPNQGFYGTQGVVQALATLGKVTKVVSRSVVTLNGQPATLQSATQTGYLASSSSVAAVNAGVTQSAQPGSVTTGFTAIVTPRVVRGDILLGMDMTLSNLLGITTQTSGNAQIQTPSVSITGFSQSAAIQPGQTLMLTGFKQSGAQSTKNGVGSPEFQALGGGTDASTNEHHLVILVTANLVN